MSALGEGYHRWRGEARAAVWAEPAVTGDAGAADAGAAERRNHQPRVLVADSWRVVDGHARGLDAHRARFLACVAEYRDDADIFWRDAVAAIPRSGDWFPRVELRQHADGTELSLRLRPTPTLSTEVDVATAPFDPRTHPHVKGPDLDALMSLRAAVQPSGAGEAIILDAQGHIIEGAYSGLLWWRGETLVQPSSEAPRIRSVTVDLILEAARAAGVTIDETNAQPADLAGCELWVLSALHGLRVARHWIAGPELGIGRHAAVGRAWLAAAERAL